MDRLTNACKSLSWSAGGLNIPDFKKALKEAFKELNVNKDSDIDKITFRRELENLCIELNTLRISQTLPNPVPQVVSNPVSHQALPNRVPHVVSNPVQQQIPRVVLNPEIEYIFDMIKGIYNGQIKSGKPDGRGKITNGDTYEGEWKNGKVNGFCTYISSSGDMYQGMYRDNDKHGRGLYIHDGDIYDGEWKINRKNGKGKMTYENGDVYEGLWHLDFKHGNGIMTYKNGDVYNGQWNIDSKSGNGKMSFINEDVYEGDWYIDSMYGNGIMTYKNGDVYEGQWRTNSKHGYGKMTYSDGTIYEGHWHYDKKEGNGKMRYFYGDVYEGNWSENLCDGYGVFTWDTGIVYMKDNGKMMNRHGKGKTSYRINGECTIIEEVTWINDKKEGIAKITYPDGKIENVMFLKIIFGKM
jgi:hypothetical protein